jgi:hypothetical protein
MVTMCVEDYEAKEYQLLKLRGMFGKRTQCANSCIVHSVPETAGHPTTVAQACLHSITKLVVAIVGSIACAICRRASQYYPDC